MYRIDEDYFKMKEKKKHEEAIESMVGNIRS